MEQGGRYTVHRRGVENVEKNLSALCLSAVNFFARKNPIELTPSENMLKCPNSGEKFRNNVAYYATLMVKG